MKTWRRWIMSISVHLYALRAGIIPLKPSEPPITIVCVSDTHNRQPSLPPGDLLIHAGDLTQKGSFDELQAQLTWLAAQPHHHKVVIAGNHDLLLDANFLEQNPWRLIEKPNASCFDLDWADLIYLQNTSTTISFPASNGRSLTIHGAPQTPDCGAWAFQYPPIRDVWTTTVPAKTDILVTHTPPWGHLDRNHHGLHSGCPHLLRRIHDVRPRLMLFGHIHAAHGVEDVRFDQVQALYDEILLRKAGLLACVWMAMWLSYYLLRRVSGGRSHYDNEMRVTKLVNAAVGGDTQEVKGEAIVIQI